MADEGFEERLERINQIAAAVGSFDNPVLQEAAFHYLVGVRNGGGAGEQMTPPPTRRRAAATPPGGPDVTDLDEKTDPGTGKPGRKSSGKKQTIEFDKSLDLYAKTGPSQMGFADFVAAHLPKNVEQKVVVAVYWLKHEAGLPQASLSHVYTAFKTINWPIPADLANAIQKAGTKNYVNSKNRDDIQLTTHGENLVEHQLTAVEPR